MGEPIQNGFIESFIGRLRDECLKMRIVSNYRRVRQNIEE
ncbi:transposase [Ochrobactrum sp. Kaboul]|nr:transposase [Ochrobactrum sp. Kaboul]